MRTGRTLSARLVLCLVPALAIAGCRSVAHGPAVPDGGVAPGAGAPGGSGLDGGNGALAVRWQQPHDGDVVSGVLDGSGCAVQVTGAAGAATVAFAVDGQALPAASGAPEGCVWDSTTAPAGAHQLTAIVNDGAGQVASATITVTRVGTTYWVDGQGGDDARDGRTPATAWRTIAKVDATTFGAGDAVHLSGTLTDRPITDLGSGTAAAPVSLIGDGPFAGRARVAGVALASGEHVELRNLEASGAGKTLVSLAATTRPLRFVRFVNLSLHDADYGIGVSGAAATDLTFVDSTIARTRMDGVLLADSAGDRFSFLGGAITDTGGRGYQAGWELHGVYASGGHGHLFDGVRFARNAAGSSLSLRRGDTTVRRCRFDGGAKMLNYDNEDTTATHGLLVVERNLFIGDGGSTALYQGLNNDQGIDDPKNSWVIFNNTFVAAAVNLGAGGNARFYDVYLRNNAFAGGTVTVAAAVAGHVHVLDHNGWWMAGTAVGSANVEGPPALDAGDAVTAAAYRDHGIAAVAPGITLAGDASSPLGFAGAAPDVGATER